MTRILVLSAHIFQIDRRIIAQANTLADSGRIVTLVSVRTQKKITGLNPAVHLVTPESLEDDESSAGAIHDNWRSTLARKARNRLPLVVSGALRFIWRYMMGPFFFQTKFFTRYTPTGNYDVIHCHDLETLPAALKIKAAMAPSAKIIYDSHELFPFQSPDPSTQRFLSKLEARLIRETDAVITVNESIAEKMAEIYGIAKPDVIYNSYETPPARSARVEREEFFRHFGAEDGGFNVIFHGSFSEDRNLDNLITAFKLLGGRANLFMLGDGRKKRFLKDICEKLELNNVYFGEWVNQDALLGFIRHADMGIIPYLGDELLNNLYCTPNKLFELIEAEVPICASDLPELRKIVKDGGIGDVYPMRSPEDIAKAIDDCRSRISKGEFGGSAQRAAREIYSWTNQAKKLLGIYDRLGL